MEEKFDNVALLPVINEKCDIIIRFCVMYFISVVCVFLDEQDFRQAVVGLPIFIYLLLLKKA